MAVARQDTRQRCRLADCVRPKERQIGQAIVFSTFDFRARIIFVRTSFTSYGMGNRDD